MNLEERYKKEICINCSNENCSNNIKETKYQEVIVDQISTTTVVKCNEFIAKNKRKTKPINFGGNIYVKKMD